MTRPSRVGAGPIEKRCPQCGQTKEAEYFYRSTRDGLHGWCIRCCRAYHRRPDQRELARVRKAQRRQSADHRLLVEKDSCLY
jgi:hypothetical protein